MEKGQPRQIECVERCVAIGSNGENRHIALRLRIVHVRPLECQ